MKRITKRTREIFELYYRSNDHMALDLEYFIRRHRKDYKEWADMKNMQKYQGD